MWDKIQSAIYNSMPASIQSHLVSIYGKRLYRKRYSGIYESLIKEMREKNRMDEKSVHEYQLGRIRGLLLHAQVNVPYYRDLFKKIRFDAKSFEDFSQLQDIPPLEKDTLRKNINAFKSEDSRNKPYFTQRTSGSTGTPLKIEVDEVTYKQVMAALVLHEEASGVRFGDRRATFAGRMIQPAEQMTPPFSRLNRAENQLLFSSYHLNDKTVSAYVHELEQFEPAEIIGYPSSIYNLAYLISAGNITVKFRPRAIITNSETLLDWQREKIEKVFNAPVRDYYGTAEYVMFARQCDQGLYHVNNSLGLIEVVNDKNAQIVGLEGDILCTTLSNYYMPLIRYRVGDKAIKSETSCSCGVHGPTLERIVGRIDDFITTRDGRRIGRLDHIFKGLTDIREAQLIQKSREKCVIKIVKAASTAAIDEEKLQGNFLERVGIDMGLDIEYVESIPKSKNGKFRAVISEL